MSKTIKAVIGAVALIIATITSACDVDHSRGGYYPQPNPVFIPSGPTYHSTTTVRVTQPARPAPVYKPAPAPKVSSPSRSK